jgi:hypothetical protein
MTAAMVLSLAKEKIDLRRGFPSTQVIDTFSRRIIRICEGGVQSVGE